MNATARREAILQKLAASSEPVSASALAGQLGVSRQIVVGDVALLRAGGARIDATPRGYLLGAAAAGYTGLVACCHSTTEGWAGTRSAGVDRGGVAGDALGETPLRGGSRATRNGPGRYAVAAFARQAEPSPASLLSSMTGGVHLHTIRCADEAAFRRIQAALAEAGVLYEK